MNNLVTLSITHVTTYDYDTPVHYALQQLRVVPRSGNGQTVLDWSTTITGGERQVTFYDQFVNQTQLIKADAGVSRIEIVSTGNVQVEDRLGVVGQHAGYTPLWLYKEATAVTAAGNHVRHLAARFRTEFGELGDIGIWHRLSSEIAQLVTYEAGHTDSATTAEMALTAGYGVCQDHAHIMIAVARQLGHPARYVSGYLLMDGQTDQEAGHAWCEIWIDPLGWIGFDVSNGISPDARYVRVATGRDYFEAAPILGIRQGAGTEKLHVSLQVQHATLQVQQ